MSRVFASSLTAFLLFVVLVWLSVALGRELAALLPNLPPAMRAIMDPETREPHETAGHF